MNFDKEIIPEEAVDFVESQNFELAFENVEKVSFFLAFYL